MIQWKYKGKILKEPPEGSEGFIYMITYNDGTKYIGKKSFWSRRRTNVKGKLRKKLVTKESDWVTYRGSSELGKQKATAGLIRSGDKAAAKIVAAQFGVSLQQLKRGEIRGGEEPQAGKTNPGNVLPVFASQGGERSAMNRQVADKERA